MADYKLVDTREIMGVKKCIYKKPGSQKQYCKYDGRMMNIANFRKMKKDKVLAKKPRKPLKARRGGENDMDDSYNYESDSDNDYEVEDHSMMGGKKTSKKGGEADDHSIMGGKKTSKKGGEADDHSMMGGKKTSKKGGDDEDHSPMMGGKKTSKGGEADDHSPMMGGKKTSKKGGVADFHTPRIGLNDFSLFTDSINNTFNNGLKQITGGKKTPKGGEAEDHSMMGGKKKSKKGGVADFHTPRIGLNDFSLFTDSINNTFNNSLKQITGGKKTSKKGGGNNIVMEGGRKSSREGGEYNIL